MIDYPAIWNEVTARFRCQLDSIHGPTHWRRVEDVGLQIVRMTGRVDADVVRLFAVLHDSCRLDDDYDPEHGERAAKYAGRMRGRLFEIRDEQFNWLYEACRLHHHGFTTQDPTIGACWDADRMDLRRVGIEPDPNFLSTPEVRRMLKPHFS